MSARQPEGLWALQDERRAILGSLAVGEGKRHPNDLENSEAHGHQLQTLYDGLRIRERTCEFTDQSVR
jgi:hypothetical protein